MKIKFIVLLLNLLTIFSVFAQDGHEQFEKHFLEFKEAETLLIIGSFSGYGKNKGKVIEADGKIELVKDKLKIVKYKSTAKSEVALLEKNYNEKVLYDGANVYIYNEENKLLNKGAWEESGKNYIGYSRILYKNIENTFQIFEENRSNITTTRTRAGYYLSVPHTVDRGEIQMHFKTGSLLPEKIVRYKNKNNNVDYVELHLTTIKSNISFDKNFFTLENFIKLDTEPQKTGSNLRFPNSSLLSTNTLAPDWELLNQNGVKRKLSEFRGKVVVLDFWATWCAPCVQAQPKLQSIHENYADVVVLGMNFNDKQNIDLNKYRSKKKLSYEMILNAEKISKPYKVISLPTAYVVDKSGKIVYSGVGYSEKEEKLLILAIQKALE